LEGGTQGQAAKQPFRVLTCLIERAGEVVSRDELQQRVWGPDSVVDFDHSIGTAINKVRDALGDTADNPRFVETLAKRGYRFIVPVAIRTATLDTSSTSEGYVSDTVDAHAVPGALTTADLESISTHQDLPVQGAALSSAKTGVWWQRPVWRLFWLVSAVFMLALGAPDRCHGSNGSRGLTGLPWVHRQLRVCQHQPRMD
jgi:DNA-binding winged helix-turn-helix (wHTH) protein